MSNDFELPPPIANLKWLAVDFDNTLAEGLWDPENPTDAIGEPIWANVRKLDEVAATAEWGIVVHTARPWSDYQRIEMWMDHYCLKWDKIICGKLLAHRYIDDRAVNADEPSWIPQPSPDFKTSYNVQAVAIDDGREYYELYIQNVGVTQIATPDGVLSFEDAQEQVKDYLATLGMETKAVITISYDDNIGHNEMKSSRWQG